MVAFVASRNCWTAVNNACVRVVRPGQVVKDSTVFLRGNFTGACQLRVSASLL